MKNKTKYVLNTLKTVSQNTYYQTYTFLKTVQRYTADSPKVDSKCSIQLERDCSVVVVDDLTSYSLAYIKSLRSAAVPKDCDRRSSSSSSCGNKTKTYRLSSSPAIGRSATPRAWHHRQHSPLPIWVFPLPHLRLIHEFGILPAGAGHTSISGESVESLRDIIDNSRFSSPFGGGQS